MPSPYWVSVPSSTSQNKGCVYFPQRVSGLPAPHVCWSGCFVFVISAVYSNALQESANSILYNGLIEELVDVLQITDKQLVVRNNSALHSPSHKVPAVTLSQKRGCCWMRLTDAYAAVLITWPENRDVTEKMPEGANFLTLLLLYKPSVELTFCLGEQEDDKFISRLTG